MPYITIAQRYRTSHVALSGSRANRVEKISQPAAAKDMSRPWRPWHNNSLPGDLQHNSLYTQIETRGYGFRGHRPAHQETPPAGLEGYDPAEYANSLFTRPSQGRFTGAGYEQGVVFSETPQPADTCVRASTPEEGEIIEEPSEPQSQQLYALSLQFQPYQQHATSGYAPIRPSLTQQWQTVNEPHPLPPRPAFSQAFDASAPPFKPQKSVKSVIARDLDKIFRVNKKSRTDKTRLNSNQKQPAFFNGTVKSAETRGGTNSQSNASKKTTEGEGQQTQQHASISTSSNGRNLRFSPAAEHRTKYVMKRPEPSPTYLNQANEDPKTLVKARPLLVVLDLNGTLLRRVGRRSDFTSRPRMSEFLHYLFSHHHVMVWSSAMPDNVQGMCEKLFTTEQKEQLIACWARDKLNIPSHAYREKVQVYKQLSWIWKDKTIQAANPDPIDFWSQENTVLIDDSFEKAASEPHNVITLEDFEGREEQMKSDVLGQVVKYLETLRFERDVSAYVRWKPFEFDEEDSYDWTEIVNDMH